MTDPIRVLVVDDPGDERPLRDRLADESGEFAVTAADDVDGALEAFDDAVDCVVVEDSVTRSDGLALLRALDEREGSVPAILATGDDGVASDAFAVGVTDVVWTDHEAGDAVLAKRIADCVAAHRTERRLAAVRERHREFTSLVNHDLRNPLTVASGYLQSVRTEIDDEELAPLLDEVQAAHRRMGEFVESAVTLARTGSHVEEAEAVPVSDVAWQAWGEAGTNDASLSVVDDGRIRVDHDRLLVALEHVFRNSVIHGSSDGSPGADGGPDRPAVEVRVGSLPDGDGSGLYVADDGPGIPADRRDQVFDAGYTTTDDRPGLGLTIVAGVADAHRGSVHLTESDRGGTRVELAGIGVEDGA